MEVNLLLFRMVEPDDISSFKNLFWILVVLKEELRLPGALAVFLLRVCHIDLKAIRMVLQLKRARVERKVGDGVQQDDLVPNNHLVALRAELIGPNHGKPAALAPLRLQAHA